MQQGAMQGSEQGLMQGAQQGTQQGMQQSDTRYAASSTRRRKSGRHKKECNKAINKHQAIPRSSGAGMFGWSPGGGLTGGGGGAGQYPEAPSNTEIWGAGRFTWGGGAAGTQLGAAIWRRTISNCAI